MPTTSQPRARNRRGEGGRLRDEIVAAAMSLVDESGDAQGISLRSVARRAGIAAPSIYPHFPDRDAIMLAVARSALAELEDALRAAVAATDEPRARLFAISRAYLDFATTHATRYRVAFGGVWIASVDGSLTDDDLHDLGEDALGILTDAITGCVGAGLSTSTDPAADAVALWLGLHGLAHQRSVVRTFPWPPDIDERIIVALARLTGER